MEDRIKFKFYAAEKQLEKLKELWKTEHWTSTPESRVSGEIEVECLLNQLIGAIDALLFRINARLQLGIPENRIYLKNLNEELNRIPRTDLLDDLNKLNDDKQSWYSKLNGLRNIGTHRVMLSSFTHTHVDVVSDENDKDGQLDGQFKISKVSPLIEPNIDVIQYFEESIKQTRNLIDSIIKKDNKLLTDK